MSKDKNIISTSPQITTKVSEHGSHSQMSDVMQRNSLADNLENTAFIKEDEYLPDEKANYCPTDSELTNEYESDDVTKATNPCTDPIAVNNIVTAEFDNTEKLK